MKFIFDADDLRPLIEAVVRETLEAVKPVETNGDRLTFTEKEAAELLGLESHVLREQRRLGRIECCAAKPGRRILYTRKAIEMFLNGEKNSG